MVDTHQNLLLIVSFKNLFLGLVFLYECWDAKSFLYV